MLIYCSGDCHTKHIVVAEEIEAERVEIMEIETWTEDKRLRIELIETLEWLLHLASAYQIAGEIFHLSVQAQLFYWDR